MSKVADPSSVFANWQVKEKDREVAGAVLAKLAVMCDPNMDESECYEIALDFLGAADLNVINVMDLVALFRCTIMNPKFDTIH